LTLSRVPSRLEIDTDAVLVTEDRPR